MSYIDRKIIDNTVNESQWDSDSQGKRWEDYDTILCPNGEIIDMSKLLDDQNRAKAALVHLQPFFSAFVGKLRPVYTFKVATQATDGVNLFINPQFTSGLSLTEKTFVLAHEIMHCVLNHLRRGKGHDPRKSNEAADYECNITLSDEKDCMGLFKFGTMKNLGALINKKYNGWGYEKIYNDISSTSSESQSNSGEAKQAEKNQQNDKQQLSEDYIKGWNAAMEDYKKGKLKI